MLISLIYRFYCRQILYERFSVHAFEGIPIETVDLKCCPDLFQDFVFPYDPLERLLMPAFTTYETQYDLEGDSLYYVRLDESTGHYALYMQTIG